MKQCHRCAAAWTAEKRQPSYKECCEVCSAYLHCCLNCRFHDPAAHNQCYIPNTDWVGDRRRANFCDEFEFAEDTNRAQETEKQSQAREKLDALWGDAEEDAKSPSSFDDLFQ